MADTASGTAGFIEFLVDSGALRFGDFTTKSGRKSPYFINTGEFRTGSSLGTLSAWYADRIAADFGGKADNLYGPAYKGIPLAAAAAVALKQRHDIDLSFTYNRKEAKDHGEGGLLVGDTYKETRRVVVVEDVVTAGTSLRETMEILKGYPNAKIVGLIIAIDRREKLDSGKSALDEIRQNYGIDARAIANIDDVIAWVKVEANRARLGLDASILERIEAYRNQYGA